MKKVLFATTALIATASVAAAEVSFSGGARFGVTYDEGRAEETQIHNRFTLNIDATAEADNGLEFFARVRVRGGNEAGEGGATAASGVSAPRVGVRTGGFTLAVGNILGGIESQPGTYGGSVGLTGLSYSNVLLRNATATGSWWWDSFSSAGGGVNGLEVIYSAGDLGLHVSHSEVSQQTAAHISYNFGDWTVALGAADDADAGGFDAVQLTLGGSLGSVDLGLAIAEVNDNESARINASFDVGAGTTITVYAASLDGAVDDAFGLGFTHSLGGATLAGGVAQEADGNTEADFGVRFNF